MAGTKISALTAGTPSLASVIVIVKNSLNYKVSFSEIVDFFKDVKEWDSSSLNGSGVYTHEHNKNSEDIIIQLYKESGTDWIPMPIAGIATITSANNVEFDMGSIGSDRYKSIISLI